MPAGTSYEDGIIEYDFYYEPWTFHYFASSFEPDSYRRVRDRFLGSYRTETNPMAVERGECGGSSELGGNHCGALHKRLTLAPGEESAARLHAGRGRARQGARRSSQVLRPGRSGPRVRGAEVVLGRRSWRSFQCKTPHAGSRHHGQHLDAVPGGDVRGVVAVRVVHRGGRAHRPGISRHVAGRNERGPHQSRQGAGSGSSSC